MMVAQKIGGLAHDLLPFLLSKELLLVVNFQGRVQVVVLVAVAFCAESRGQLLVHLVDLTGFTLVVLAIGCKVHEVRPYLAGPLLVVERSSAVF